MRTSTTTWLIGSIGLVLTTPVAAAPAQTPRDPLAEALVAALAPEARPSVSALRLGEADLLARFAPEVAATPKLRERALTLWRSAYAGKAAELKQRFTRDDDWRPALAEAAALIDDYLETSLLPRAGATPAEGDKSEGNVWIETIDPRTEQRTRVLRPAPARKVIFAPEPGKEPAKGEGNQGLKAE